MGANEYKVLRVLVLYISLLFKIILFWLNTHSLYILLEKCIWLIRAYYNPPTTTRQWEYNSGWYSSFRPGAPLHIDWGLIEYHVFIFLMLFVVIISYFFMIVLPAIKEHVKKKNVFTTVFFLRVFVIHVAIIIISVYFV
jgi:hypothetical protein